MAGQYLYSATLQGIAAGTASATSYGAWCLDPVTNPITIVEFGFSLDGTAAAKSFQVSLAVMTSPNSGTISVSDWPDQRAPASTTCGAKASTKPAIRATFSGGFQPRCL